MAPCATFSFTNGEAMAAMERGDMVPWEGTIVVEGIESGDYRVIEPGALTFRTLPLPLMAMFENPVGGGGHDGAQLAGRIDTIERRENGEIFATGVIDPTAPGGSTLIRALDRNLMRGVSVDLDTIAFVNGGGRGGPQRKTITSGRISGVTATPFQAFMEATIGLSISTESNEALAASGASRVTARVWTPIDPIESLIASAGATIPVDPPAAWFDQMAVDGVTPLTVTQQGRVYGHVAAFGSCHIGFGKCEPVPRSRTNYAAFRTGSVVTAEGTTVRTGPIVMDTVHPDLRWQASDAQAFYADTGCTVADVVAYEDKFGIMVVGALRPTATPENIRAFRASDISPDWRTVNGQRRECCAMLAVNNSGFKVPQSLVASAGALPTEPGEASVLYDNDGDVLAMVASGGSIEPDEQCGCDETEIEAGTEFAVDDDRRAAAHAALDVFMLDTPASVRQFGKARQFDESKITRGSGGRFFGPKGGKPGVQQPQPGSKGRKFKGRAKKAVPRPDAPDFEEDESPMKSPNGAKLVDFHKTGGKGIAIYEDGAVYDGKGWQS